MNIITKPGHTFDQGLWYYLAGPMTGLPEYNLPAFEKAQAALEETGIRVRSPHTIDHGQHTFHQQLKGDLLCGLNVSVTGEQLPNVIDLGRRCNRFLGDPVHSQERGALPYQVYLKAGYRMLLRCEGIILLHGWTQSKGTKHELHLARTLGYPVYTLGQNHEFLMEIVGDES